MSYFTDLGRLGDLNLSVTHMYTKERRFLPGAGNDFDAVGVIGFPHHKLNINTIWHIGKWTWFNQVRWLDDSVFDRSFEPGELDVEGVGDWTVVDSTLGYRLSDRYDVRLTVENLLDREPALASLALGNLGLRTYLPGVIGRYATVGFTGSF